MKLSAAILVKNSAKKLPRVLKSIKDVVDEIVILDTGSNDNLKAVAAKFGAKVFKYTKATSPKTWITDFAHARSESFSHCTGDLVFWIDSDDELIHPEKLKMSLKAFENQRVGAIALVYNYSFNEFGRPDTTHWRERVVRKDWFRWMGKLHESMIPARESTIVKITDTWINHHKTRADHAKAVERNISVLEAALKEEGDAPDARTLFGLGQAYRSAGKLDLAHACYHRYLELSGWDEEKYIVLCALADDFLRIGRPVDAYDQYFEAIKVFPKRADAYFGLACVAYKRGKWKEVIDWTEEGFRKGPPSDSMTIYNPRNYDVNPMKVVSHAYFQMGMYKECALTLRKILQFEPNNAQMQGLLETCEAYMEDMEVIGSIRKLEKRLKDEGSEDKLYHLAQALPKTDEEIPTLKALLARGPEPAKSVVIYCPATYEYWSPASVKTGIGGSEEAVINMANQLRDRGWKVTVYNHCDNGDDRDWDGVEYKPFWTMNKSVKPDVFVYWRQLSEVDQGFAGHKTYLWLHDLQRRETWYPERWEKMDKIMVLSQYHRKHIHFVPDDKIWITRNGIDPSHFDGEEKRDPLRCIYASSPDRGLEIVLDAWPMIREKFAEAELDVFYGFTKTFDGIYAGNKGMMAWKERMIRKLNQPGINYHGRVGHQELARHMMRSSLWLYPTTFEEISCITAMKMQAAGAFPVCSQLAAVNETVRYGFKVPSSVDKAEMHLPEKRQLFLETALVALAQGQEQEPARSIMMDWARKHFAWSTVAGEWAAEFEGRSACRALQPA